MLVNWKVFIGNQPPVNQIKQNKIPEIILSVKKQLKDDNLEVTRIDIYVDFLTALSEKECFYLVNNRSLTMYENDMEFLIETLSEALTPYEDLEEYEFCQQILTAINRYKSIVTNGKKKK
jgi:hypothetical protein